MAYAVRVASWDELLSRTEPWVIAHRGFSADFPENTLAAFRAAIAAGADAVALDVTLTGDGVPVVLHHEQLDRTTDGKGLVCYASADTIAALDAGSWFDVRFAGERVPTLARVLEEVGGQTVLVLELRTPAFDESDEGVHLESIVADLIRRFGLEASVVLSSFQPRFFARIERSAASVPRILLCDQRPAETDLVTTCRRWGAMGVGPDADLVEQGDLLRLRAAGLRVFPWTINREERMRRFLAWGVDGIITDRPDVLRRVIGPTARPSSMSAPT